MSIDETCLADGELYTVITDKAKKGKQGCLAALIKGTKQAVVTKALEKVPIQVRFVVREITLDMADTMDWIARVNFPNAVQILDRFHVQKEVTEAVQQIRIKYRHEAIAADNTAVSEAKQKREPYHPKRYENGDTQKELLARSRYLLFQLPNQWRDSQKQRAETLFREFPDLKQAYELALHFRSIYASKKKPENIRPKLKTWYEKVSRSEIKEMLAAACTVERHEGRILNYFENRATNASAESFNAKLKGFRALVRGVRDTKFFLFRITKLYA
jgi:transposase